MRLVHALGAGSLDRGVTAHKLSAVATARSYFLTAALATTVLACGDNEPEPRPVPPVPAAVVPSPSAAELTGWPAGLGRLLVLRLVAPGDGYRLVVPELGDRRFADSAIAIKAGDSIPVTLIGRRGNTAAARVRVVDAEVGAGSCLTWPSVEIDRVAYAGRSGARSWRIAVERDSVTPVLVDSLPGLRATDSLTLVAAIDSMLAAVPADADSALRGIPFGMRRAYAFRVAGAAMIAAELARTSSAEADPREERLFVVGERRGAGAETYALVFSRRMAGRADSTGMVELLAVMTARATGRGIIALGVEEAAGLRLQLVERVGRKLWKPAWSSAVSFC